MDPFAYPCSPWTEIGSVEPPQYSSVLRWMKSLSGRAVSLDFWARGNYARRLIANKKAGVTPVIVPVANVSELRWAHRRLAILGYPVEFLWQGKLSAPQKVLHLHPGGDGDLWDAGWGYVAALGTRVKLRRDKWYPVLGYARLLPEAVASWLVDEAGDSFIAGDVFVTPAELVGVLDDQPDLAETFAALTGGARVRSGSASEALLNIELPVLDRLSPKAFSRLLLEQSVELSRVRYAFRKLVESDQPKDLSSIVAELNFETSELALADRYQGFRARVTRMGGVVSTAAAFAGAAVGAASGSLTSAVAVASLSAAAAGLCECVRTASEHKLDMRRNPLFLLWQLGSEAGGQIRESSPKTYKYQSRSAAPITQGEDGYFHWLAPPSVGVGFLAVKDR